MARGDRRGQGLARVAVVVRAGAAPLWWLGVFAAGVGLLIPGLTGRRIGVMAGPRCSSSPWPWWRTGRRKRYTTLGRAAARAGKHDVLQDRAVSVRNWRRGHRWWLLLALLVALAVRSPCPPRAACCSPGAVPGCGSRPPGSGGSSGPRTRCCGCGSTGSAATRWSPGRQAGQGVPQHGYRGGRRGPGRVAPPRPRHWSSSGARGVRPPGRPRSCFSWWRAIARLARASSTR